MPNQQLPVKPTAAQLRANAARNVEPILRAARQVYGEAGSDVPVEAVARRAEVGERSASPS